MPCADSLIWDILISLRQGGWEYPDSLGLVRVHSENWGRVSLPWKARQQNEGESVE